MFKFHNYTLVSKIQIKLLIYDIALLLDLIGNSEGTKLLILTIIFCLVFTAPANWRVELRAKIGHYRNRCLEDLLCPKVEGGTNPLVPPPLLKVCWGHVPPPPHPCPLLLRPCVRKSCRFAGRKR